MKYQRLFERRQQMRHLNVCVIGAKQTHLALELSFDLFDRQALRTNFAHAAEHRERVKVVSEVTRLANGRAINDSRFGPTAHGALAQTEHLLDLANGITRLNSLIVRLSGNRRRE